MNEKFLSTNSINEVISCLKTIERELPYIKTDYNVWKIIIMLQHNALQACMVEILRQGNILNVLSDRSRKTYEMYAKCSCGAVEFKGFYMLPFKSLYKRIKSPKFMETPIKSTEYREAQIQRLNDFRNSFTHFIVGGWSLQLSMLPKIIIETNEIITELLCSPRNTTYIATEKLEEIEKLIVENNQMLHKLHQNYSA